MQLESILRLGFEFREGVYYYTRAPEGIDTRLYCDPTDKRRWSPWRTRNFEFLKGEIDRMSRGLLLADIGAGQSDFRELYEGFEVVPIDFCPFALVTVVSDLNKEIPLRDGSTNVVMLSNVLEHIAEPARLLRECRRVLKGGGVLLGAVPFLIDVHQRPYDYYRYTDICLTRLLIDAGFTSIEVVPVVSHHTLFKVASERFFGGLIEHHRDGAIAQRLFAFALRVHWLFFSMIFFKLGKGLSRFSGGSPDAPLGYHFKAVA